MNGPNLRIYWVARCLLKLGLIAIFSLALGAYAQSNHSVHSFIAAPALARNPESGWVLSFSGSWFHVRDTSDHTTPNDAVSFGGFYSQNRQWGLSLPFMFYGKNRSHAITGEVYAADTWFNGFGVGKGFEGESFLRYDTRMFLMRIQYMKRMRDWFFVGAKWWGEHQDVSSADDRWQTLNGHRGGWLSGPAAVAMMDTRDDIIWTTSGHMAECSFQRHASWTGSDYTFNRLRLDLRKFIPFGHASTWGTQLFFDDVRGDVPFYQLPGVAAARRGRGYYEGRYRDQSLLMLQSEVRLHFHPRWSWTCFAHASLLAQTPKEWFDEEMVAGAGTGLRYHFGARCVNTVRFDVAIPFASDAWTFAPNRAVKFYVSLGEAF